ncbi:MAG: hypothetical protein MUO80_08610 [Dehalococcoidia bacterium]|nr:hypothetical protein [Dehalococcoidia bacterium]
MEKQRTLSRSLALLLVGVVLAILALPALASADWRKMDPPPDVDKSAHGHTGTMTCWQATAANMLAGAGYGDGTTVQQRADDIYNELVAHYGTANGGWPDTALSWWLGSTHNTWAGSNPYTVVTFYGNRQKTVYSNTALPKDIGNELRRCEMVGLSIGDPACTWWHEITIWGDSGGNGTLTTNPAQVIVTDSDSDTGGDVQTYTYSAYGNGWKISYPGTPYITDYTTLCPTDEPSDNVLTQKVVGSYRIHQDNETPATDLHYRVGTDVDILTYRTTIDWATDKPPTIVESVEGNMRWLTVDWDLSNNPVPYCTWVTITTEFVLPYWNAIWYEDVYFTYPDSGSLLPPFWWELHTPELTDTNLPDICGGYVVGSFDLFADEGGENLIGQYRLLHEYDYFQDPELHYFVLMAAAEEPGAFVGNLRFGHSYGFLDADFLREFQDWMTYYPQIVPLAQGIEVKLDWDGLLPYPTPPGPPPPPPPTYDLTVDSTTGGSVTEPGEGTFTYDEGTVVNLVATPDADYRFVNWTGDVGTIADVEDATTTITMNGDYEITANFEGICGFATAADLGALGLVSVGLLAVWTMRRRRRGPEYS